MELKHKLYAIDETAELLSLDFREVHRLADSFELIKRPSITAESILDFARRKRLALKQESAG